MIISCLKLPDMTHIIQTECCLNHDLIFHDLNQHPAGGIQLALVYLLVHVIFQRKKVPTALVSLLKVEQFNIITQ